MPSYVPEWAYNILFVMAFIMNCCNLVISIVYYAEGSINDVALIINLAGNVIFMFLLSAVYYGTVVKHWGNDLPVTDMNHFPRDWQEIPSGKDSENLVDMQI